MLALIGRGKTNGEIADELFVSEGTVKTHINHVFTKLQSRDRATARCNDAGPGDVLVPVRATTAPGYG